MLLQKLDSNDRETELLPKTLKEVLKLLKNCYFSTLTNGKYNILGDDIFLIINEYETKNNKDKKAEQHEKYIDIQYMIKGKETIGIGYSNENNKVLDEYDSTKDRISYSVVHDEKQIQLKAGMFAIFFPSDIHRPEVDFEGRQKVRKAVIKLDKKLLVRTDIKDLNIPQPAK
jgi:biofilm protein TabA